MVGPTSLALARVQVRYDANADGRIDSTELQSPLTVTSTTSGPLNITRGQFRLDALSSTSFNPEVGVLQITSTGGTAKGVATEIPISGSVQYSAYLPRSIVDTDKALQVVVSPLTTLAANRFQQQLMLGTPEGFNIAQTYAEQIGFVADALGVSNAAGSLLAIAPERDATGRLVAELKANALLNVMVALASGKHIGPSDATSIGLSATVSAEVSQRLAQFITSRGSINLSDASDLKLTIASVLPASLVIDDDLSKGLAQLMATYAQALNRNSALIAVGHQQLPDLARISAGLNTAMNNGSLNDSSLQAALKAGIDRLVDDLNSAMADTRSDTSVYAIVKADGAWIDQNIDGKIDGQDKINGVLVAADFGAGKNADPATHHLSISQRVLPSTAQAQVLSSLGTDDRAKFLFDTADQGGRIDLKWAAAAANAVLNKQDIVLNARGAGVSASLSVGKLPAIGSTQGITASLGAVWLLAAGDAKAFEYSTAEMTVGLGGNSSSGVALPGSISGPVRVQAAGQHAIAKFTAISNTSIQAADLNAVATGAQSKASLLIQSVTGGTLSANSLGAASYADRSTSEITLTNVNGSLGIGGQLSALASGDGSNSLISITNGCSILIESGSGTTKSYGSVSAIASGTTLVAQGNDVRTTATINLYSATGNINTGALRVSASGANSIASVTAEADRGTLRVNGPVTVSADGTGAAGKLTLSAYSPTSNDVAMSLTSTLTITTSGQAYGAATAVSLTAEQGGITLQGALTQQSLGSYSSIQTAISAEGNIGLANTLLLNSLGAFSTSKISLTSANQISIGASLGANSTGNPGGSGAVPSVSINAAGYGSSASLEMSGDIDVKGDVLVQRTGAAVGANKSAHLRIKSFDTTVVLEGDLAIKTTKAAAGARSVVELTPSGLGTFALHIGSDLEQAAIGYDSSAVFDASASGSLQSLTIDGDWTLHSNAYGNLGTLAFGSSANVMLSGSSPELHIGGNLTVTANGEFARSRIDIEANSTATAISGSIDGQLTVSASGYGSRASASFVSSAAPAVDLIGGLLVKAAGSASAATFNGAQVIKATGGVSLLADSGENSRLGAIASATIAMDSSGSVASVDAVRANDTAVLKVNNLSYGGSFNVGSTASAGTAYLQLDNNSAASIKINYNQSGVSNILLGSADANLNIDAIKANRLDIEGFRFGIDRLMLPSQLTSNGLTGSGFPFFSDLDTFLRDSSVQIGQQIGSATYLSAYAWQENALYVVYDLDGVGFTGLIRLKDYFRYPFNFTDAVTLPTADEVNSTIINSPQTLLTHPSSVTKNIGDINMPSVQLSAAALEKKTLTMSTGDGDITLQSLNATATKYLSQAIVELTPGSGTAKPYTAFTAQGRIELNAEGPRGYILFSLDQGAGSASFNSGISALASADVSLIEGKLTVNRVLIDQILNLEATGVDAKVNFVFTRTNESDINLKMGSTLSASGLRSGASLTMSSGTQSTLVLGGLLGLDAAGSEANANVTINYRAGNINFNRGASVVASGDAAEANLSVSQNYLLLSSVTSTFYIGNQLVIDAAGTRSKANASFTSNSYPMMQIDGALRTSARGDNSEAKFLAQFIFGGFNAKEIVAEASGQSAKTDVNLTIGNFSFSGGSVASSISDGNLVVANHVQARSTALDASSVINLRTFSGDIAIAGDLTVSATLGNTNATTPSAKISLGAGAGRLTSTNGGDVVDYGLVTGYGAVSISGDVLVSSAGYDARTVLDVFSVGRNLTLGGDLDLISAGTRSSVSGQLITHSGPDRATPPITAPADIKITGPVHVEASGSNAEIDFLIRPDRGVISLGDSLSVFASGVDARAVLSVESPQEKINVTGDLNLAATAAGSESSLKLATTSSPISVQGGLSIVASGTSSDASAKIEAASAAVTLAESISVGALGEASRAELTLHQGAGNSISVSGTIAMHADSGNASSAGALATADLQLGKLSAAPMNIFLDAIQQDDAVSMSLKLFSDGGKAQLGNSGHAGTTTLSLGDKSSAVNQLLDAVDISFSGSSGKAIIEFGADQDNTTDTAIQQVLIKGFRLGHDELHFDGLANVATTARTLDGFINSAMNHFNTGSATGTPSTQFKVADVFVGGNDSVTYLAYDHDGTGISAIITLEGVAASQYKTANGMV
jgi:hypothetical protein